MTDLLDDMKDVQAIATLALASAKPNVLADGGLYAIVDGDSVKILTTPGYDRAKAQEYPAVVQRSVTVFDAASLLDYIGRYEDVDVTSPDLLEVWASLENREIVAVIDGVDAHRVHKATLKVKPSPEWREWAAIDDKLLGQVDFAQFIEDHLSTIAVPDGGQLLDICQTLEAHQGVSFKMQNLLPNGQRVFQWEELIEGKAGQKGDLPIPTELTLVLRPFLGCEPVAMIAKFRYRLNGGDLRLGVHLMESDKALEDAFASIVDVVEAGVDVRVNHGIG